MIMLLGAALMVVAGCKKDDKNANGEMMTFSAGFGNSGAKTEINGLDMSWNKGDAVMINGKTFTADESGASTTLSGEKTYQEGGLYKAYFPASIWDNGILTLPATQTYNGTNLSGVNPMYSQSGTTDLTFSNLCAMVKLQLTGSTKIVKEIRVSADQPLSGEFEIVAGGAGYKAVMKSQTSKPSVTLNCGTGVDLSTNNVFYVALPEGEYTNLKFFVVTNDNMCTSIEKASATLVANNLHDLVREPEFHEILSPEDVKISTNCVDCVFSVGGKVTVPSGSHACEFGLVYSETDNTPTIEEGASKVVVHSMSDDPISGTKSFTADLGIFEVGVLYHVCAYAMIDDVRYSTMKDIVGDDEPQAVNWIDGKSPKQFSVSATKKVYFSQGNLQYIGNAATPYWKFADHQFDFLGTTTGQNSDAQNVDRDLFGWGATGIEYAEHGTSYQPWSTETVATAYGPSSGNLSVSAGSDWGSAMNTPEQNANNTGWHTLSGTEWNYLLNTRKDGNNNLLYTKGKIGNCTPGLIILPDNWDWNEVDSKLQEKWATGPASSSWLVYYSHSEWAKMEAAGAVFITAAGQRDGTTVERDGIRGYYWSSSKKSSDESYLLYFLNGNIIVRYNRLRNYGSSVRLVTVD